MGEVLWKGMGLYKTVSAGLGPFPVISSPQPKKQVFLWGTQGCAPEYKRISLWLPYLAFHFEPPQLRFCDLVSFLKSVFLPQVCGRVRHSPSSPSCGLGLVPVPPPPSIDSFPWQRHASQSLPLQLELHYARNRARLLVPKSPSTYGELLLNGGPASDL